jgi:hypothetical protein
MFAGIVISDVVGQQLGWMRWYVQIHMCLLGSCTSIPVFEPAPVADGCSKECRGEVGYTCSGASKVSADTCSLPTQAPAGKEYVKASLQLTGVVKDQFISNSTMRWMFMQGIAEALALNTSQVLIEMLQSRRSQDGRRQVQVLAYIHSFIHTYIHT